MQVFLHGGRTISLWKKKIACSFPYKELVHLPWKKSTQWKEICWGKLEGIPFPATHICQDTESLHNYETKGFVLQQSSGSRVDSILPATDYFPFIRRKGEGARGVEALVYIMTLSDRRLEKQTKVWTSWVTRPSLLFCFSCGLGPV